MLTRLAKADIQMQAERESGRADGGAIGNSEPRSNNFAKWAYSDPNYSND